MKKVKILSVILVVFLGLGFNAFAQEDSSDDINIDDMFESSEDVTEAIESDKKTETLAESDFFKSLTITGDFKSEFGGFGNYSYDDDFDAGGVLLLENTLYMAARASKDLSIHGSVYTGLSNKFTINLKTLYFDYLIRDTVYVTGGKRSFTWGYPRLFGSGDLYGNGKNTYGLPYAGPLYTNILNVSDNHAVFQVRVPWSTGTFTAIALYDFDKLTGNASWKNMSYAGSLEFTVFHQIINVFSRTYGKGEAPEKISFEEDERMHPILGLETKRTIAGMDWYAQGMIQLKDFDTFTQKGIDYVVATGGFYKLWDSFDPNIGVVMEYQYVYDPNVISETNRHSHKIAVEGGIKRLGKNKNLKFGIDWGHNFTEKSGTLAGAFYISDLFRHGQWKNLVGFSYGGKLDYPKVMIGSVISVSMSY